VLVRRRAGESLDLCGANSRNHVLCNTATSKHSWMEWSLASIVFSSQTCRPIVKTATLTTRNYTDDRRCACRRTWGMAFRTMSRNSAGGCSILGAPKNPKYLRLKSLVATKIPLEEETRSRSTITPPRLSHRRCLTLVSSAGQCSLPDARSVGREQQQARSIAQLVLLGSLPILLLLAHESA
jgi:hypothetical protein